MLRIIRLGMYGIVLAIALAAAPAMQAQQSRGTPAAPVPPRILTSQRVFVSNAGMDASLIFNGVSGPDEPYNQFYAAMKNWGRYELAADPSDADLVFEIHYDSYDQLQLSILDAKTHFTLWHLMQLVGAANLKSTKERNFTQAMANLMDDLKKLTTQPSVPTSDK